MVKKRYFPLLVFIGFLLLFGCAATKPTKADIVVNRDSVLPGSAVTRGGQSIRLLGQPIAIGDLLPSVLLVDAMTMQPVDIATIKGDVVLLNIVPSIDTPVCEAQTNFLSEGSRHMPPQVRRITISRDTPFAQKRFAREAKIENVRFLSDAREGAFGRSVGLLTERDMLLARAVIILDKEGRVRYLQVVPELSQLPDLEKAFLKAEELSRQ